MEAADANFTMGLRYISAARRCFDWCGDDPTESRLQRHGEVYRARAFALMTGSAGDALDGVPRPAGREWGSFKPADSE